MTTQEPSDHPQASQVVDMAIAAMVFESFSAACDRAAEAEDFWYFSDRQKVWLRKQIDIAHERGFFAGLSVQGDRCNGK